MPARDDNGKPLSGAAKRKRAKAQAAVVQQDEAKRKKTKPVSGGLRFEDLPAPALQDPAYHVAWWNQVLMVCADQVIRDEIMPLEKKLKFLSDFAAKAGMLRDKAAEQEKIKKILAEQKDQRAAIGLEDVSKLDTPRISRPPR